MKKTTKLLTVGIILLAVFILWSKSTVAAGCQLTGASFSEQTISVGQNVILTTTGQGCSGQSVTGKIYGRGGLGLFLIKTVGFTFSNNPTAATLTTSISASDIAGRNGNVTAFLETTTDDGSSKINSQDIVIKAPVAGSCQLSSAQWHWNFHSVPILGSPVHMIVNSSGCAGYTVEFDVYNRGRSPIFGTVKTTFNSSGTQADGKWIVEDSGLIAGNDELYFTAAAGNSKIDSGTNYLIIPSNSENGCLNCTYPVPPNTCQCADGFSGDRGFSGSCSNSVCRDHIGDAHSDAAGTGTGGGNGGCDTPGQPACKPGTTQTFSFDLTKDNPLKGGASDFTSLVKIIAQWIFNLAIPIAVAMIVYAGILFLTAAGEPAKVTKAREVLTYAVIGLAIILIGSGFVTLIQSILELGGTGTTQNQNPGLPVGPQQPTTLGVIGSKCSGDRNCVNGFKCKNAICQRPTGNLVGEPCNGGASCDLGLACDSAGENQQIIDGQTLGTCFETSAGGGRIGDVCTGDKDCISGLKCNQICQRKSGNLNGEACLKTSSPSNCQSKACHTVGTVIEGDCVPYSGT